MLRSNVDTVLTQVVEYTVPHFAAEKQLMREFGYPRYVEHKKVHDGLRRIRHSSRWPARLCGSEHEIRT